MATQVANSTASRFRPALYYPYIHVRSEHWLKATLLCAPTVKRIVPEGYTPEDEPLIAQYSEISGSHGPLLQAVKSYSDAAIDAQFRLLKTLRLHEEEIVQRYARGKSPSPDGYWIHTAKFNQELLSYLLEVGLAWPSRDPHAFGHRTWNALHPVLGSAVMTTLGLSIATEQKFDVVTPSVSAHETLLATSQEDIFAALLREDQPAGITVSTSQVRNELGQLVVTLSGVNLKALRPEDIPELQSSKALARFQGIIRDAARKVERGVDREEYESQLRGEGHAIVDAWQQVRLDLRRNLRDTLFQSAVPLAGAALKSSFKGVDGVDLAIAGGVAVIVAASKVRSLFKKSDPYQYLTQIASAQDRNLRLTFPLGLEA